MFSLPRIARASRILPLAFGSAIGGGALYRSSAFPLPGRPLVMNDAPRPGESIAKYAEPVRGKGISHFGGKIDYDQLTFGSFAGMVTGYFFGRISKILVGAIVTSLMATEYLASTGHIDLTPFYRTIYDWTVKHWHREVLVQDPSFKYSFGLAFLIAAYNA